MTITYDTITATEIANLRDDCTAAHEMIEVQRQRIAQLESEVEELTDVATHCAWDWRRGVIRGNTYRCRALALVRQVDEERIWATFYQSEVERLQTELNALRGRIEAQRVTISAKNDDWKGGDVVMTLSAVEEMLAELVNPADDGETTEAAR